MNDFVAIVEQLTDFIQDERISSHNEGVDMVLGDVREWMRLEGITPKGEDLPDLLDDIAEHIRASVAICHQAERHLAEAIKVIRAEPCPFGEGPMADGWAEAWATFLNRLGNVDGLNDLYANSTAVGRAGKPL